MAATASQTVAGHPIAMKVGGRRMSLSKSPSAQKSFLASSPPKQTEVPKPTAEEGETKTEEATATSPTSPTHKEDGYPRPEGGHHDTAKEGEKDEKKKEEQHANKKKEKKEFDHVKQQNFNKNPPAQNNYTIKQPAGKTMM